MNISLPEKTELCVLKLNQINNFFCLESKYKNLLKLS